MPIEISELQTSALQEAGNIGSGHAAIALSQLMGRKIMIAIPSVHIFGLEQIDHFIHEGEENIVQVSLMVLGSVKGIMIFALQEKIAVVLCDIVMGQPKGATKIMGELQQSALKEIGNIVTASYLNAVSEMTGLSLMISTPDYRVGKNGLFCQALDKEGIEKEDVNNVLCIKTEFIEASTKVEGFLIFVPFGDAIKKIITALGV